MSVFHLFAPTPPGIASLAGALPSSSVMVGEGELRGTLYDLDDPGRVLLLYGETRIPGEIWRCPAESLPALDRAAGVPGGTRRRVAREVPRPDGASPVACWLYVAGPALCHELLPERRVAGPA